MEQSLLVSMSTRIVHPSLVTNYTPPHFIYLCKTLAFIKLSIPLPFTKAFLIQIIVRREANIYK